MKLTQLAAEPQLIKLTIDAEAIVNKHSNGEPLEFYIYDRQSFDDFIKIATMKEGNTAELITLVKDMILDEEGKPVIKTGTTLPADVLTAVIQKVVEALGK
jgi:flavin-dependent dehydrogenase